MDSAETAPISSRGADDAKSSSPSSVAAESATTASSSSRRPLRPKENRENSRGSGGGWRPLRRWRSSSTAASSQTPLPASTDANSNNDGGAVNVGCGGGGGNRGASWFLFPRRTLPPSPSPAAAAPTTSEQPATIVSSAVVEPACSAPDLALVNAATVDDIATTSMVPLPLPPAAAAPPPLDVDAAELITEPQPPLQSTTDGAISEPESRVVLELSPMVDAVETSTASSVVHDTVVLDEEPKQLVSGQKASCTPEPTSQPVDEGTFPPLDSRLEGAKIEAIAQTTCATSYHTSDNAEFLPAETMPPQQVALGEGAPSEQPPSPLPQPLPGTETGTISQPESGTIEESTEVDADTISAPSSSSHNASYNISLVEQSQQLTLQNDESVTISLPESALDVAVAVKSATAILEPSNTTLEHPPVGEKHAMDDGAVADGVVGTAVVEEEGHAADDGGVLDDNTDHDLVVEPSKTVATTTIDISDDTPVRDIAQTGHSASQPDLAAPDGDDEGQQIEVAASETICNESPAAAPIDSSPMEVSMPIVESVHEKDSSCNENAAASSDVADPTIQVDCKPFEATQQVAVDEQTPSPSVQSLPAASTAELDDVRVSVDPTVEVTDIASAVVEDHDDEVEPNIEALSVDDTRTELPDCIAAQGATALADDAGIVDELTHPLAAASTAASSDVVDDGNGGEGAVFVNSGNDASESAVDSTGKIVVSDDEENIEEVAHTLSTDEDVQIHAALDECNNDNVAVREEKDTEGSSNLPVDIVKSDPGGEVVLDESVDDALPEQKVVVDSVVFSSATDHAAMAVNMPFSPTMNTLCDAAALPVVETANDPSEKQVASADIVASGDNAADPSHSEDFEVDLPQGAVDNELTSEKVPVDAIPSAVDPSAIDPCVVNGDDVDKCDTGAIAITVDLPHKNDLQQSFAGDLQQSFHGGAASASHWHVELGSTGDDSSVLTEDDESEGVGAERDASESSIDEDYDFDDDEDEIDDDDDDRSQESCQSMEAEYNGAGVAGQALMTSATRLGNDSFAVRNSFAESITIDALNMSAHSAIQNEESRHSMNPTNENSLPAIDDDHRDDGKDPSAQENGEQGKKGSLLTRRGVQRQSTGDSLQLLQASASGSVDAANTPVEPPTRRGGRRRATPASDTGEQGDEAKVEQGTGGSDNKKPLMTRRGVQRQPTGDSLQLLQASANGIAETTTAAPAETTRRGGRRKPAPAHDKGEGAVEQGNDEENKKPLLTRRGVQRQSTGDSLQLLQATANSSVDTTKAVVEPPRRGGRRRATPAADADDEGALEQAADNSLQQEGEEEAKKPLLTRRGVQRQSTGDSLQLLQASASGCMDANSAPIEPTRRGGRRRGKATDDDEPAQEQEGETECATNDDNKKPLLTRRGVQRQSTGDSLQLLQASVSGTDATEAPTEPKRRGGRRKPSSTPDMEDGDVEQENQAATNDDVDEDNKDDVDEGNKGPLLTRRGLRRQSTGDSDTLGLLLAGASGAVDASNSPRRGGRRKAAPDTDDTAPGQDTAAANQDGGEDTKAPLLTRRGVQRQSTGDSDTFGLLLAGANGSTDATPTPVETRRRGGRRKATSDEAATAEPESEPAEQDEGIGKKGPMLTRRGLQRQSTGDSDTFGILMAGKASADAPAPEESKRRGRRKVSSDPEDGTLLHENDAAVQDADDAKARRGPMMTRRGVQRQSTGDSDTFGLLLAGASGVQDVPAAPVESKLRGGRRRTAPDTDDVAPHRENDVAEQEGGEEGKKGPMVTRRGVQRQATGDSDTFGLLLASSSGDAEATSTTVESKRRGGRRKPGSEVDDTVSEQASTGVEHDGGEESKKGPMVTRRGVQRQATGDSDTFGLLLGAKGNAEAPATSDEPKRRGGRRKAADSGEPEQGNEPASQDSGEEVKGPMLTRRGVQRQSTGDSDTFGLLLAGASGSAETAPAPVESKRRGGRRKISSNADDPEEGGEVAESEGGDESKKGPMLTRRGVQRQSTGDSETFGLLLAGATTTAAPVESRRRGGRRNVESAPDDEAPPAEKESGADDQQGSMDEEKKAPMLTRRGVQRQSTGDSATFGILLGGPSGRADDAPQSQRRGGRRRVSSEPDDTASKKDVNADDKDTDAKGPLMTRRGYRRQPTGDADEGPPVPPGHAAMQSPADMSANDNIGESSLDALETGKDQTETIQQDVVASAKETSSTDVGDSTRESNGNTPSTDIVDAVDASPDQIDIADRKKIELVSSDIVDANDAPVKEAGMDEDKATASTLLSASANADEPVGETAVLEPAIETAMNEPAGETAMDVPASEMAMDEPAGEMATETVVEEMDLTEENNFEVDVASSAEDAIVSVDVDVEGPKDATEVMVKAADSGADSRIPDFDDDETPVLDVDDSK